MKRLQESQIVWFFGDVDDATIGYCPLCEAIATYREPRGLQCPNDRTHGLSIFHWDGDSEYPE